jgi:hypothetical protein
MSRRILLLAVSASLLADCASNAGRAYVPPIEHGTLAELRGIREVCIFAGTPRPGKEAQWANAKATLDLQFQRYFDRYLGSDTLRVVGCKEKSVGIWLYDKSAVVQIKLAGDCKTAACFREFFRQEGGVDVFLPAFTQAYAEANGLSLIQQ